MECVSEEEIISLDEDGKKVFNLVMEVTRRKKENKAGYLTRVLTNGSKNAKILKCADRISNLTDLHLDTFDKEFVKKYIDGATLVKDAVAQYRSEVESKTFPAQEHTY